MRGVGGVGICAVHKLKATNSQRSPRAPSTTNTMASPRRTIAIIPGTGNMGKGLSKIFAKLNHHVIVGSRDANKAQEVVNSIKAELPNANIEAADNKGAAAKGEIIFWGVSGPLTERHALLASLASEFNGKIVVDLTNIMYLYDEKAWGQISAVEQNRDVVAGARWTTGFKCTWAAALETPITNGIPRDTQVSSDDAEAQAIVIDLINETGFRAVNTGPLINSRILEVIGPKFIFEMNKSVPKGTWGSWRFF